MTEPQPRPVEELSYEEAREELVRTVAVLEAGQTSLEDSMSLWERGQALAEHCRTWLERAQDRLTPVAGPGTTPRPAPSAATAPPSANHPDVDDPAERDNDPDEPVADA